MAVGPEGMAAIDLKQRGAYRHFTPVTIRWCDTDGLRHVNNVAIASYFEAGRVAYLDDLLKRCPPPHPDFALVRIAIDFRAEFNYPGTVEVGSRLLRVGTKSLTTAYAVFLGSRCMATGEAINVFFDTATRQSVVPSEAIRQALKCELADLSSAE